MTIYRDDSLSPRWQALEFWRVFLHTDISVALDLACERHCRAEGAKCLCISTTSMWPQDYMTAPFLSHTEKTAHFVRASFGFSFHRGPGEALPSSWASSWCVSMQKFDKSGLGDAKTYSYMWGQQTSSLRLLSCQCHRPKLNLSPDVFLLFLFFNSSHQANLEEGTQYENGFSSGHILAGKWTAPHFDPPEPRDVLPPGGLRHWISTLTFSPLHPLLRWHQASMETPVSDNPIFFPPAKLLSATISAEFYVRRVEHALCTQGKHSDYPSTSTMTFTLTHPLWQSRSLWFSWCYGCWLMSSQIKVRLHG